MNRLKKLETEGQSLWLDYIRRDLLEGGELKRLIDEDGLKGMTSNPTIFEKAIGGSDQYDDFIRERAGSAKDAKDLYEQIAIRDIRAAADTLRPVYDATSGEDGYVSLEASPRLANDTEATLKEVRRLTKRVDRDNVMIKVPGTDAGIPAIEQLVSEGYNVNVTLLFSRDVYERVAEAYLSGLETFVENGGDPSRVASVASFFVSRVDVRVEKRLDAKVKAAHGPDAEHLRTLYGKAAIANAKLAYARYQDLFNDARFEALRKRGARPQRVLWASTSTKNPDYPDVFYPEALIGPETVDTMPPKTMDAFRDHGEVQETLTLGVESAREDLEALEAVGIDLDEVTKELVEDGVKRFADDFEKLLKTVEEERKKALGSQPSESPPPAG